MKVIFKFSKTKMSDKKPKSNKKQQKNNFYIYTDETS